MSQNKKSGEDKILKQRAEQEAESRVEPAPRAADASTRQSPGQSEGDSPKRVQYGQGYSKDHPAQPGTDQNLKHKAQS